MYKLTFVLSALLLTLFIGCDAPLDPEVSAQYLTLYDDVPEEYWVSPGSVQFSTTHPFAISSVTIRVDVETDDEWTHCENFDSRIWMRRMIRGEMGNVFSVSRPEGGSSGCPSGESVDWLVGDNLEKHIVLEDGVVTSINFFTGLPNADREGLPKPGDVIHLTLETMEVVVFLEDQQEELVQVSGLPLVLPGQTVPDF